MHVEEQLKEKDMKFVSFREPDIGHELTSIAILPSEKAKKFCSRFKLALQNVPVAQSGRAGGSNPLDVGSNPAGNTMKAGVAQLAERCIHSGV